MHAHASSFPSLVLVGAARLSAEDLRTIRELQSGGATVVAWQHSTIVQDRFPSPNVAERLARAGVPCRTIAEALGEQEDFAVDEAVIRWMKDFGRRPLGADGSFRERFRHGPLVLWWWAELYLYHETPLRLVIRDIEALARLVEKIRPARISIWGAPRRLEAAARSLVAEVEIRGRKVGGSLPGWKSVALHELDLLKMWGTGLKSLFRRPPHPVSGAPRALFLTHASMWRTRRDPASGRDELFEMYFDRILPAVSRRAAVASVAVGPPVPFRQRRLTYLFKDLFELGERSLPYRPLRRYFSFAAALRLTAAFLGCWRLWFRFRRIAELERALSHRGVFLGSEARACFRDTFLRQFPWAIRSYHEIETALRVEAPDVMVLYAESSGLGRAALAAARVRGVPSFAVQHGIMYPQYYSHEHAPDEVESEADGVPIPTRTAVFGSLAKSLLVSRGSYPEERIVITGSPKFDALVQAAAGYHPEATRRQLGVPEDARLVVLASRFTAVGAVFAELVAAVERLEGVWLWVKPHQAESPDPYQEVVARLAPARTRLVAGGTNLLELLVASDGLITVDSFASSEALVLGRPVLVVNLPSNLAPLVDRGVALGVARGESIEKGLRELLVDRETRERLEEKRKDYLQEFAFGADGRSTERIVQAILETAEMRNP